VLRRGSLALLLVACTRTSTPPSAPVDVTVADVPDAGMIVSSGPPPKATTGTCVAALSAGKIDTKASCQLDEKISEGPGRLEYPCDGEGHVHATFGDQELDGSMTHGEIAMKLVTTPDWHDGCDWESHQTVTGSISRGKLSWYLQEKVVRDTGQCYGACTARAAIEIQQMQ